MKKTLKALQWLLLVFTLITFTACSKLTTANFDKIHNDMTTEQVKEILGEPTQVKSGGFIGFNGTVYIYRQDKTEVKVTFLQGKVISKDGSFAK
jgi:transcription antitermination factor NusG